MVVQFYVSHRNLHEPFMLNNRVDIITELVLPYELMYVTLEDMSIELHLMVSTPA